MRIQLAVSGTLESIHGTKVNDKKLAPAKLFKKDEPMPDVNVSLNEDRGEEENTCEEEASGLTQAESKSPEKEIEASGSGDRKNRVVTTINLDGLINEIVIDRVKYQMVPLGNGDVQPKEMDLVKKTPVGINETNKIIDEMLTVPPIPKKKMRSCHISSIPRCISPKKFQDIMKKKEQKKYELKEMKEEHKRKHLENAEEKKRCQKEAKKKQEENEKTKIKKAKAAVTAVLAAPWPKCEQRAPKPHLQILRVVTLMQSYMKIHSRAKLKGQLIHSRDLHHSAQSASLSSRAKRKNQQLAVIHCTVDDGSTGDV